MLASISISINPFLDPTSAFGLGLLLGIFIFFVAENVFFPPKKVKEDCPVCKEVEEAYKKEKEDLEKEWKDQGTGYKN